MILANSFAVEWVTEPTLDMIGLSGIPGLCTLVITSATHMTLRSVIQYIHPVWLQHLPP